MWRSLVSAPALGAGGRRFESGHPDQPKALPILARPRTHLALNAATAVVFAIGYSWRAGDHVALDKNEMGAMWLGGKLTYRCGMRVTRQADRDGKLRLDGLAGIGRRIR